MRATPLPDSAPRLTAALFHPRYWPQWFSQALLWLIVQLPYPVLMQLGAAFRLVIHEDPATPSHDCP